MTHLIWLSEAQMLRIEWYLALSHGCRVSMIAGSSATSFS